MLPPSNSFLHQSLKLAEVSTNMQSQETLAPPPPYSQAPGQAPQSGVHSDTDAEDDENPWDTPSPNPITINIDASINVHGNSNTIILAAGRTNPKQPDQQHADSESAPASATTVLQTAQKHRQAKLTEMATTIIAALQESRNRSLGDDGMDAAPIEININTGVKVKGSKNVICGGGGRLPNKTGAGAGASHTELNENDSRKRRAQSVRLSLTTMHCGLDY